MATYLRIVTVGWVLVAGWLAYLVLRVDSVPVKFGAAVGVVASLRMTRDYCRTARMAARPDEWPAGWPRVKNR